MHIGAKLQQDIVKVQCRWCCYRIIFTCDIENIFRQILMHALDRTACTSFKALRILKLLIELLEQLCPNSPYLPWLRELFDELLYVDDFFGGADTVAEATK